MLGRTLAVAILSVSLGVIPGHSQNQNTDPQASNPTTGNGPPAVVLHPDSTGDGTTAEDKKKAAVERPITGVVTDAEGKPVVGAVVQLKNTRTLQIRSFITRDKGEYYFAGLSKDVDYEVKATFNGHASPMRTLSSFDPKPQPVLNLQIK